MRSKKERPLMHIKGKRNSSQTFGVKQREGGAKREYERKKILWGTGLAAKADGGKSEHWGIPRQGSGEEEWNDQAVI